ncbi:uncharacterized protein LOC125538256 [Triticum urartu]|uniref:uncharacterized protein LOC125538256 n=1 Tax=Triticum urartu TaxID=4572 RepID=UPI002044A30E|nr:uncharacterized protein LOC125538256 [Triticum urartu]
MSSSSMSSDGGPTVAVKLFIDKAKRRVLFAESDKEFVDVLFSFLTLPLGTIVRLFDKQSHVGCLDKLYKSVECLGEGHFQAKPCKAMLLAPVNAAAAYCHRLQVKVDDSNPVYHCKNAECHDPWYSSASYAVCRCRNVVDDSKFIITDDLQVSLASTRVMFSLMDQFGIPGNGNIEEKVLQLNSAMMTRLLRRAMLTKQPLTGLYFNVAIAPNGTYLCKLPENLLAEQAAEATDPNFKAIKARLVQTKDNSSVLYAEVGQDFVDLAFGLLCIPVGTIMKTFSHLPQKGCMGNLYRSVAGSVKEECQGVLLTPKVAPFFGCSSNVLQVEELAGRRIFARRYLEMNPRSHDDTGVRGYIKGTPINFMVTNDLQIMPLSLTNTIQLLHASNIPKNKLVEKELTLNKTQVLKIVRAAFETREALSSTLLP